MNNHLNLAIQMLKDGGFRAYFTSAREDAIMGKEFLPDEVELLERNFDRLLFYVDRYDQNWVSSATGPGQLVTVIHASNDVVSVTRTLMHFLRMRQLSHTYGNDIQHALWNLQNSICITCFRSETEIEITHIATPGSNPFDFMIHNPIENLDLRNHRSWRVRFEFEHWVLVTKDGEDNTPLFKDKDILKTSEYITELLERDS